MIYIFTLLRTLSSKQKKNLEFKEGMATAGKREDHQEGCDVVLVHPQWLMRMGVVVAQSLGSLYLVVGLATRRIDGSSLLSKCCFATRGSAWSVHC